MSRLRQLKSRGKAIARLALGRRCWPIYGEPRLTCFEDQVFSLITQPGDTVYDVGANVGVTALLFARLSGPKGLVVAFEPVLETYRVMCRTIQLDVYTKATIVTLPYGVSDGSYVRSIAVPDQASLASMMLSEQARELRKGKLVRSVECRFVTLDEVVRDQMLPAPDVIKVDVEGAELLVIKGAQGTLERTHPVLHLEVFAPWQRAFGYTPWDLLGRLRTLGYEIFFECPEGLVAHEPTVSTPFPEPFSGGYNVVCLDPMAHRELKRRLELLREGRSGLLPMAPPPVPNSLQ